MFQNRQKVVVVSSGDATRVIKVQAVSGVDAGRYPTVDTTGVTGRDQQVQIVSGGDETRFPKLQGLADARSTADSVITALTPAAWYRNATEITEAGGFASAWGDYTANGRDFLQAVGTNQPAYAAGVITCDAVDNFMKTAAFTLNQPTTIYFVMKNVTWVLNARIADGDATNSGALWMPTATPQISLYAGSIGAGNSNLAVDTWGIVAVVFNGAASSTRVNNTAKVTADYGANNMGGLTIGRQGNNPAGYGNPAFQEIVVFPDAHNDATQDSVITALDDALTVF